MKFFTAAKSKLNPQARAGRVFSLINDELERVEEEYRRQVSSNIQVIDYLGDYLQSSGGKRVRPALLILANYAVGGNAKGEDVIRLATVMEMLHTATLVHDDIIDNADLRRNRPSVNARFGNQTAVLMGDWLYMSAFETSLRERSLRILDILTRLTRKMTEGELLQLTTLGRTDISEETYFDILRRKTAYLFSACCEIGAILGGATERVSPALRDYGMNLGIAFQLADDLLDFTSDEKVLGKAAGSDLTEGKITLPLILLRDSQPEVADELRKVMLDGNYGLISRENLIDLLEQGEIIETARCRAYEYAKAARKNLDVLPETEYREALGDLPAFVVERNR
ncbi:MAG TPA: polyprenyl synthetase family protein [Pyrinomonadaceae bacterium]|nr:polyprenyl synthetase family protein [Pyrinomonadaceae bacterium]